MLLIRCSSGRGADDGDVNDQRNRQTLPRHLIRDVQGEDPWTEFCPDLHQGVG